MKIDHIGIATNGIEETAAVYREALGLSVSETEEVPSQKVRVAMLPIGESSIELPSNFDDSPISKF
jgi:catechol 2,3-dioxygenase-like lactoylglutathione lyase family enzyme